MLQKPTRVDRFRGLILGTAVGDALGLPAEGISPGRISKLFPGRWRHRFIIRRGMVSDDTDHTLFVAQSLLAHPDSVELFARRLAWCLRLWFLSLPAGIGFATLRSIFRLWLGFSPARSGVFSAGNGPAMRSAPIGAYFASSLSQLDAYVQASTRVTHTDPKAATGARAVAHLAAWAIREELLERPKAEDFLRVLEEAGQQDEEWTAAVDSIGTALGQNRSVEQFADALGLARGVTGYIYHTVPVVAYAWYRHFGSFEDTLSAVLNCGGDADTTGAIAGAVAGAVTGEQGIREDWLHALWEWPRSTTVMRRIADRLEQTTKYPESGSPVHYFWPGLLPRNLFFLMAVLLHGLRRLAPPY